MSRQFYYLVAGLPDILFDDKKLSISTTDFRKYLSEYLTNDEMALIKLFFWRYDNNNILKKLQDANAEIDPKGNLSADEIDAILSAVKEGSIQEANEIAPAYFSQFIEAYKKDAPIFEGKNWDLQFSELYYNYLSEINNTFISDWFKLEANLNNLITALNCRKQNFEISKQLIGTGELVDKLTKSSAKDFGLSEEIPHIDQVLKALDDEDLLEQELKIDLLKWNLLDETSFFHYFSIEKLFVFLIKLSIIERWISLDKEQGLKLFKELLNSLETTYEFPEEFSLK